MISILNIVMFKNNLKNFTMLNKLHEQEQQFKRELSKTFL